MKRKLCMILLVLCVVAISAQSVSADLIIEPYGNAFYLENSQDCVYMYYRPYLTNGPDGGVSVRKEPGSNVEVAVLENGVKVTIGYGYYLDGVLWGVEEQSNGWLRMDHMRAIYDRYAFLEEHEEEFIAYTGGDYSFLNNYNQIYHWAFPGDANPSGYITKDELLSLLEDDFTFDFIYEDPQGLLWGYSSTRKLDTWICISAPTNRFDGSTPINPTTGGDPSQAPPLRSAALPDMRLAAVLVLALVGGTVLLIRFAWKPKKQ